MKKNIVIIHYNTPYLTECLVRSINLFMKDTIIYIFDNSDKYPFTANFDNVTIIDNTSGSVINFDAWLENYPNRFKSTEMTHKFGSAKHCYSVEKCMEIINDNFILLDSDVLLKKDISDLYDENVIFAGEIITQPKVTVKRVLPFVCFINVNMCKENGVHYFDDNYMHGLYNNKIVEHADWYDTGAGFYVHAKEFNYKEIKTEDYCVHYGHGSWNKNDDTQKRFLFKYKHLYEKTEENIMERNYKNELKRYCQLRHLNINIDNPKTIQDKINWLKVNDLSPLKTDCADKVKLHEYSKEKLGKDICIPIIKTYNSTKEINWNELPEKFVIKCNHGSGMNIIVKDKSKIDKGECISKLNSWMGTDFAFRNGFELQYHDIKRKIFVEEFKNDGHETLHDYKFWCFNGEPKMWTINNGNGHGDIMYYSMDGKEMNLYGVKHHDDYKKPSKFDEMVEYSKKLSEPFKFVRVDFYEVDGVVYLGELTFTPGSGFFSYRNRADSIMIGNMLNLSTKKTEINKKVIYTCITGDYDDLKDPQYISEGFDYVCFTDNLELKSNIWEIRPLPIECEELSQVKKQRYVKINPHLLLNEYDISIWTDGCVSLIGDLNELVNSVIEDDISVYVPKHPIRNCIYKEAKAVVEIKKDTSDIVKSQIERYKQEGFPSEYGLLQSNILIRKHNEKDCIRLMEAWFDELKCNSHRDQLSFNYVLWKNSDIKVKYLDKNIYKSEWFSWNGLHKRKSRTINKIMDMKKIQTHDIGLY